MDAAGSDEASGFARRRLARLAAELPDLDWLAAETCTSPALSPDGNTLAVVSDRDGAPRVWLSALTPPGPPVRLDTGEDYVRVVTWSPDGEWLCLTTAPSGSERTRVRALRPDGSQARVIGATPTGMAWMGRWQPGGHVVGLAESSGTDPARLDAYAADVCSGRRRYLASGTAATVCTFSHDGRYAVVRLGSRGARRLLLVDTRTSSSAELLGADATVADARFAPDDRTIYLHTDAGREFAALLALPRVAAGYPEAAELIAARDGAELERFALEPTGRAVVAVWNVEGCSELEFVELASGQRRPLPAPPAEVITSCSFAQDGGSLVLAVESGTEPPHVLRYPLPPAEPVRLAPAPPAPPAPWPPDAAVRPQLHRLQARDGLELSGWLYRPPHVMGPLPTVISLHSGPEAQERPTFNPLFQTLLSQGISIFAPNVRGSSGFGSHFVHADDRARRFSAITDVADVAAYLTQSYLADFRKLGCIGRSYGGYLTLAAMVQYPRLFCAGVVVSGVANYSTFFENTEPWIAASAVTEYGDPARDAELLQQLSPIHQVGQLSAPLLIVHGDEDTNVPVSEARLLFDALRLRDAATSLIVFPGEGHEIVRHAHRKALLDASVEWLTTYVVQAGERSA